MASSFLYDATNVVQELSSGTPTANLLSGGIDEVSLRTDAAGHRSFLSDALGSTLALTDPAGSVLARYTYEPFVRTAVSGATSANPYQYTGRENDGTGGTVFSRSKREPSGVLARVRISAIFRKKISVPGTRCRACFGQLLV